jgi:hypothetical protein
MHAVMAGTDTQLWHNCQAKPQVPDLWAGRKMLSNPVTEATGLLALAAGADGRMDALMGDKTLNIGSPVRP